MWRRLFTVAILVAGALSMVGAATEKIDLPRDTSHPEQDVRRAIKNSGLGFIGVYGIAYTIPGVEGVYRYNRFSKHLYSQLKVIRGTSDVHGSSPDDFDVGAMAYARRYNRFLLDWIEKHHCDWLGPRER